LSDAEVNIEDLDASRRQDYCSGLSIALAARRREGKLLTHSEIQAVVDKANDENVQTGK